jgi:beta-glucanase (GH16 family)
MKLKSIWHVGSQFIGCVVIWVSVSLGGGLNVRADWQLSWNDEFNGSSLDTNRWLAVNAWGTDINNNGELELYTNATDNVQVANGNLRIIGEDIGTGGNYLLTSARLTTQHWDQASNNILTNMTETYVTVPGAVEIRARIPLGTGLWPAIWFLPRYTDQVTMSAFYGNWPNSGEVDLMEHDGTRVTSITSALHYYGGNTHGDSGTLSSAVTNWHTYRWEWFSNSMNMIYDGVTNFTISTWNPPPGYSFPAPFDADSGGFFIIMNLALGGNYTGNPSAADVAANLPAEMDVDYVRVYTVGTANVTTNYSLTVANGTGSGSYTNGEVVGISTNAANFAHWSADANIADTNAAATTYTMGPSNDTIRAYYVDPPTKWTLVWNDEFSGTALNTNVWWCDLGAGSCINGNNELQLYTNSPTNVQVTNGILRIISRNIGGGADYLLTSARLITMNIDDCSGAIISNMTPIFVKVGDAVEWRARLPQGTGLWPALWLLPSERYTDGEDPIYGVWPNSGEIDVMENNGAQPDQVAQNLHYYNGAFQSSAPVSDVTQWHIYRLEWYTNQMVWMVDGVTNNVTSTWNPPPGYLYPAPFDANSGGFYIIMNLALGGNYTGNPSAADVAASLPAEMDIDYVRVYAQVAPLLSATQTNGGFIVSWLQQPAAWVLEQTTELGGGWTQVLAALYQTNQNRIFFSIPPPLTNNTFYRLRQQ